MLPPDPTAPRLVLASGSATRAEMLRRAGIAAELDPPAVDEAEIKLALRAEGAAIADCAQALAEVKARQVSPRHPGAIVLGADQMLACGEAWFDKPADRAQARAQLAALAGRTHELHSVVVAYRDGAMIWHAREKARLRMRPLSESFLDAYLDAVGAAATRSVGAYQVEGLGAQLFEGIDGDWFTILGLPLLPLLAFLRANRVVPA